MLHSQYLCEGAKVEIPELSGFVAKGKPAFEVKGVFAGGMGICVQLQHIDTGAEYALKGVRPDHIEDQATANRFLDELQVWLSASSCNLVAEAVAVVKINESPCVLATWMANGDLAHSLQRLGSREKFETLLRLVRSLEWVRSNLGVIHRDLKPANVLLDSNDLAYVADWGLARPIGLEMKRVRDSLSGQSVDRPDRTQAGSFLGTVTYAAPEQIMGSTDIDHRADIYALGCMMFEFETGTPPFVGKTVNEIARLQIQEQPRKLGGWFKRTELGLEKVIARCLEKKPANRYPTYEDLEGELISLAADHGVRMDRCALGTRYERTLIGKGQLKQSELIKQGATNADATHVLVEAAKIEPFLEEAINLIALSRYTEAELLLRPHVHADLIEGSREWLPIHSIALNWALCLMKIGRPVEAEQLLARLKDARNKPAEFYVNYSLLLLDFHNWKDAIKVCSSGLGQFPSDPDIQGNLTIALVNDGDLGAAVDSAVKRIKLRRDIHALEEAAGVLQRQAAELRDADLPKAVEIAKMVCDLLKEGLALNPRHYPLHLKQVQLRRFAFDERTVLSLSQAMIDADACPKAYRQLAFAEMVEKLSEGKSYQSALDLIQRSSRADDERLKAVRMRTLARHRMIGKETQDGKRAVVPEVRDYFLTPTTTGRYRDPVITAEVQDWMGDSKSAMSTLERHLSENENDWDGIKLLAMINLRQGNTQRAVEIAQLLATKAPWRAESYDLLSYVAANSNRPDIASSAKKKGDEVFEREDKLYTELRTYLDA
jgi:Flp pilus assembly protein TadD